MDYCYGLYTGLPKNSTRDFRSLSTLLLGYKPEVRGSCWLILYWKIPAKHVQSFGEHYLTMSGKPTHWIFLKGSLSLKRIFLFSIYQAEHYCTASNVFLLIYFSVWFSDRLFCFVRLYICRINNNSNNSAFLEYVPIPLITYSFYMLYIFTLSNPFAL